MLMGVHTNMCVLGRPFGLRNLARSGKNVVLVRDLTDTMYNSRKWPYVSHFEGTNRIIEHIEKYVAPTIISTDLTGQPAFRFQPDDRPRAVFLIGEDEYKTEKTLPAFASQGARAAGRALHVRDRRPQVAARLPGGRGARRRRPAGPERPPPCADGRARWRSSATTSKRASRWSASARPAMPSTRAARRRRATPSGRSFDPDVLGGHYTGHHGNDLQPVIDRAPSDKTHLILAGVETPFVSQGSLYKISPLAAGTQPLLMGTIPGQPAEPVAWINAQGPCAGLLHVAGPSRRLRDRPRSAGCSERRLLGTRSAAVAGEGRDQRGQHESRTVAAGDIAPLLIEARARFHPARPWPHSRFPATSSSIWSWPSRSSASRSRSRFDERGRLWVVQYLQYPFPAGLKMVSHDGVWRAVYDKVPPPPPHHFRGKDKITIHEDTDGDGVFDRHKTFVDGLNIATAVAHGRGGVWVLNPPYLLFYPDRNNDDVPDGDPEVHLQGFGLEDTHSVVNSLRWGPDGWLYAAQGSTVTGHVTRPGLDDGKEPRPLDGPAHLAISSRDAPVRGLRRGRRQRVRRRDRRQGADLLGPQRRRHPRVPLRAGRLLPEGLQQARAAVEPVCLRLLSRR